MSYLHLSCSSSKSVHIKTQVVQRMFNMMDNHKEAYENMKAQRNELDERWKAEKEALRKARRVC